MAVVQISRIQIRRGKEQQGTGVPQLASGELAWAVDTQNLYIGNGSVAEGAPYVGNTKLLSEHDDLFSFADNYIYKKDYPNIQTGDNPNVPVLRSLQDRLDDIVSVRSFGVSGDGSDQTVAFQRAIDQLFLNPATKGSERSRVILKVDPGVYSISSTLYIPPHATIVGSGKEKTIFKFTGTGNALQTVNGLSTVGNPGTDALSTFLTQNRYITLEGFTIELSDVSTGILLQDCRNSLFRDIKIKGVWTSGGVSSDVQTGIQLNGLSSVVTCKDNVFEQIEISNVDYLIQSKFDINQNTFENCKFNDAGMGIVFGNGTSLAVSGQLTGPAYNTIKNCNFSDIERHALWIENGQYNLSDSNRYISIGNDGGQESNATYSVIKCNDWSNQSNNDFFSRTADLGYNQTFMYGSPYIPEIEGPIYWNGDYSNKISLFNITSPQKVFRLPANDRKSFVIEYLYQSNQVTAQRQGTLSINANPFTNEISIADDFEYIGDSAFEENLTLDAIFVDENGDGTLDTLAITVLNSTTSDTADFYWKTKTKS